MIARVMSVSQSLSVKKSSPASQGDPSHGQRGGVRVGLGSGVRGWRERLNKAAECRLRVGERRNSGDEVGGGLSERGLVGYFIWQNPCLDAERSIEFAPENRDCEDPLIFTPFRLADKG